MTRRRQFFGLLVGAALPGVTGCTGEPAKEGTLTPGETDTLAITATPFDDGESIPARYTCEGGDVNPELKISGVADDTSSLALIVDDPDAGKRPYVHWLLWNIPSDTRTIPRSVAKTKTVDSLGGAHQGTNSAGNIGYMGPCPPTQDGPHTYRFMLHALDTELSLDPGAGRGALEDAMSGHVLDKATLTGTFERG